MSYTGQTDTTTKPKTNTTTNTNTKKEEDDGQEEDAQVFVTSLADDFGVSDTTAASGGGSTSTQASPLDRLYEEFAQDDDAWTVFEAPTYMQSIYCESCGLSVVQLSGKPGKPTCPGCNKIAKYLDSEDALGKYDICPNDKCENYLKVTHSNSKRRCQAKIVGSKRASPCNSQVDKLDFDLVDEIGYVNLEKQQDEEEDEDASEPKIVRQLKTFIKAAQGFVQGAGTHHRSKGGAHTSSAREMHSSAHKSKKQVRERYADKIQQLLDSDKSEVIEPWLRRLATATINQVMGK